jgi:hypothetical protein
MENPGVPNFEEELRKASQADRAVEIPEKTETKLGESKVAKTAKKVSANVTKQTKKIVAGAVKAAKKSTPLLTNLSAKVSAQAKKLFTAKRSTKRGKLVLLISISAVVLTLAITALIRLEVISVTKGIPLMSGESTGTSVMVDKFAEVKPGDVIVGVLPGTKKEEKQTLLGSIFSQNDQTYAIFDGEVIWQLPLKDLVGKALFVEAKTKLF